DIMKKDLDDARLEDVAALEMKLVPILAEMELNGLPIDHPRWRSVTGFFAAEAKHLEGLLKRELKLKNLNKSGQMVAALQRLGLPITHTSGEALAAYSHLPVVQHLTRYRRVSSFVNGVGREVLQALDRSGNGRVRCTIHQLGCTTGR